MQAVQKTATRTQWVSLSVQKNRIIVVMATIVTGSKLPTGTLVPAMFR